MTVAQAAVVPVNSTLLTGVGYDDSRFILELHFHDGSIYCYFDVPQAIHEDLLAAGSKGAYFNRQIRGRFRYAPMS